MDNLWIPGAFNDYSGYTFSFTTKNMGEIRNLREEDKSKVYLIALAYASLSIVIIFMIFIYVPDSILYARKGAMKWMPFLLIFGALPYSLHKSLDLFYPKYSFLIAIGLLLIVGPLFGIQINRFDQLALERDGVIVEGTITKKYQFKPSNRDPEWLIQATFLVNDQEYVTFPQEDEQNAWMEKMKLDVIYSKRNPGINMLLFMYKDSSE